MRLYVLSLILICGMAAILLVTLGKDSLTGPFQQNQLNSIHPGNTASAKPETKQRPAGKPSDLATPGTGLDPATADAEVSIEDPVLPSPAPDKTHNKETVLLDTLTRSCPPPAKLRSVVPSRYDRKGLSEGCFRTKTNNRQLPEERVLVIGDSLSIALAQHLESHFATLPGVYFKRLGKVSSGLARPDFFDWEHALAKLAAFMRPDTVIIMVGTNDNQSLKRTDGTIAGYYGNKAWDTEYTRRVNKLFELCLENNPKVNIFWVGAPIMQNPQLVRDVQRINRIIQSFCDKHPNCFFIDTWDTLADDQGRFTRYLVDNSGEPVIIRADDGVHLSDIGADMLATRCLQIIKSNITLFQTTQGAKPSG